MRFVPTFVYSMKEISNESSVLVGKRHSAVSLILIVQIVFTIGLIAVGWFYTASSDHAISEQSLATLRIGVIFLAITSFVLRRMLFRWDRLKNTAILKGIPGLLSSLTSNAIILGAMAQTIAIIGFLIAALGGVKTELFTFGAVALILFLVNFPRRGIWLKIVGNLEKSLEDF